MQVAVVIVVVVAIFVIIALECRQDMPAPARLGEAQTAGPGGQAARQERTWPALRGRLARHPQLEGFGGSGRPQPRRSTTHEHGKREDRKRAGCVTQ